MFLANIWIQLSIVAFVIIFFLIACFLNSKTKLPKGVEAPKKCQNCTSNSCMIKLNDLNKIKDDMKEYLNCEEGKHE